MVELDDPTTAASWLGARVRGALCTDSRRLRPGDGFIAWPGAAHDARRFVRDALAAGAAACVVERAGAADADLPDDPRVAVLDRLKPRAGELASIFYRRPSQHLSMLAVTGTNGKTSVAWWTAQALTRLGRRCGVVGTLGIGEPPRCGDAGAVVPGALGSIEPTGLTTPDPVLLQAALRRMADAGFAACAIEASSIGIAEHRLAGSTLAVAMFTNFTPDHLDYHADMATYWACKRALFAWPGLRAAVVNVDDPQGASLADELAGQAPASGPSPDLWTVSTRGPARLAATNVRYVDAGLAFDVVEQGRPHAVRSRLIGDYNASNLLVMLAGLRALGVPLAAAAGVVGELTAVPGRMQTVPAGAGQPSVVVDYAHTPDALDKALAALRPLAQARGGRLWCVFGCGGNRDTAKRPLMGAIAQRMADAVVVTSDNPRGEAPEAIVGQIVAGMSSPADAVAIVDRRAAIAHAVARAGATDVVLIAGKGHEATQEIAGVKHAFVDADVAARALGARAEGHATVKGGAAC